MTFGMSAKGSALGASPESAVPLSRAPSPRTAGTPGNGVTSSRGAKSGQKSQEAGISETPEASVGRIVADLA